MKHPHTAPTFRRRSIRTLASLFALSFALQQGSAFAALEKGPYLQQVTTSSVIVCMEGGFFDNVGGEVRYGTDPSNLSQVANGTGAGSRHEITLSGLQPNTKYYYRAKFGSEESQVFNFWTAPPPGTPFNFLVVGDNRTNHDAHTDVIEAMLGNPYTNTGSPADEARILVNTGDLVDLGILHSDWKIFFEVENPILGFLPLYPTFGNHELGGDYLWSRWWVLGSESASEKYYSFQYGNVFFIVIDSNIIGIEPDQQSWLEDKALEARQNPEIDHVIGIGHHPIHSAAKHGRNESSALQLERAASLTGGKMQVIFTGHDHLYQHFLVDGLHSVVAGGGGAPIYGTRSKPATLVAAKEIYHYTVVKVNPTQMNVASYAVPKPGEGTWLDPDSSQHLSTHDLLDEFTVVLPTPPTPVPTDTPEPTATPEATDTPEPTATPEPTDTPEPTATPTFGEPTLKLTSPKTAYQANDLVSWSFEIDNRGGAQTSGQVWLVLELFGDYYFYNYQSGAFLNYSAGEGLTSTPRSVAAGVVDTHKFLEFSFPPVGTPLSLTWIFGWQEANGTFLDQFPSVTTTHP